MRCWHAAISFAKNLKAEAKAMKLSTSTMEEQLDSHLWLLVWHVEESQTH